MAAGGAGGGWPPLAALRHRTSSGGRTEPAGGHIGAGASRHPKSLEGVPCYPQRDCAQLSQRDRTCLSTSCAMLQEANKPDTLQSANCDDQCLAVVQRYCDTTDANAQLQILAHYGVSARLVQTADFELIE